MAGGMKELVLNSQERAISTDINRLQKFKGADIAELFRYFLNVGVGTDDFDAGGVTAENLTIGTPLSAEIINGFMVSPTQATLGISIGGGVLYAIAPDGADDDSIYKYVRDPGVSAGVLTIANNVGGGGIRIDVIECFVTPTVMETDNRDIFNTATNLFTATEVNKAVSNQLLYRVRTGTPSSGFPGVVEGWLPLAVVSIPDGATSVDTMTFWDVRPLLSDRAHTPMKMGQNRPDRLGGSEMNARNPAVASGYANINMGGRRVGGIIQSGTPQLTDLLPIDLTSASNKAAGYIPVSGYPWYVYICTPFGLPRWARYTVGYPRVPRSPRGIPVVTDIACDIEGRALSGVPLPLSTGLLGATAPFTEAVAVFAGVISSTGVQTGFYGSNGVCEHIRPYGSTDLPLCVPTLGNSLGTAFGNYTFAPLLHYPENARRIKLEVTIKHLLGGTVGGPGYSVTMYMNVNTPGTAVSWMHGEKLASFPVAQTWTETSTFTWTGWVEIPNEYPLLAGPYQVIQFGLDDGGVGLLTAGNNVSNTAVIVGWEL